MFKNIAKNGKFRWRRNIVRVMIIALLIGIGYLFGNMNKKEVTIIENDKVKIEYFDIKNGDFDIIVESKNDYNISPEWNLDGSKNYSDAYLVGKTKKDAMKFYKKNKDRFDFPFTWNQ